MTKINALLENAASFAVAFLAVVVGLALAAPFALVMAAPFTTGW